MLPSMPRSLLKVFRQKFRMNFSSPPCHKFHQFKAPYMIIVTALREMSSIHEADQCDTMPCKGKVVPVLN
jgi:hypothetical protein